LQKPLEIRRYSSTLIILAGLTLLRNKVALLQNHGILSTGKTIEEAVFWFVSMEKCCHTQLMADAACAGRGGSPIKIADEEAATTYVYASL
jgi:ribulose-5-phosphate 4-epimerase/fuculose-1-phosphate aldolase